MVSRNDIYDRLYNRLESMKENAQKEGDGVRADKIRKCQLDVLKLERTDKNGSEEVD